MTFAEIYGLEPEMERLAAVFTFVFLATALLVSTSYLGGL